VATDPLRQRLHERAGDLLRAALNAVDPMRLVMRATADLPTPLRRGFLERRGKLCLIAAGKAALSMAAGAEDALPRPATPAGRVARSFSLPPHAFGLVVTKDSAAGTHPRLLEVRFAGHPAPDQRSVEAGECALHMLEGLGDRDVAVALISGGASALLACPADGLSLDDIRRTTILLVRAGAPISDLNCVRKHLSRTAGGALAAAAAPATLLSFVVSDVPGNRLDTIGSGPTVPDPTTFQDALAALETHGVRDEVPPAILDRLERGARGEVPETHKPGDPCFRTTRTFLSGSSRTALDAAARRAREIGYRPFVLEDELIGEARRVGEALGKNLRRLVGEGRGPLAIIAGGETTVKVTGDGEGGRSQELALAAAKALDGCRGVCLLAAGTDGEDGLTDAAGAIVDGQTLARARELGVDIDDALARNDSYPALDRLDALVRTGATGTNVMDIAIGLVT